MTRRNRWCFVALAALLVIAADWGWVQRDRDRPVRLGDPWHLLGSPRFKTLQGKIQVTVFWGERSFSWEMELWADTDRSRVQFTLPFPDGPRQFVTFNLPEGTWVWLPFAKRALRYESGTLPTWHEMWQIRTDKMDLVKNNYTLQVMGRDRVAGRFCLVLELAPRAKGNPTRKLWVHPPIAFPLRVERYSPERQLEMRIAFTEVRIDEPLPLLILDPRVPPDWREEALPFQRQRLDLSRAHEVLGFLPLLPTWLPPGYVLEGAYAFGEYRWKVAHLVYTDGLNVISVFQHPIPRKRPFPPPPGGFGPRREPPKGPPPPPLLGKSPSAQAMFPQRVVVREVGNLLVVIVSEVTKEWLDRMADSLPSPVPGR